jgi:hypothetical protein
MLCFGEREKRSEDRVGSKPFSFELLLHFFLYPLVPHLPLRRGNIIKLCNKDAIDVTREKYRNSHRSSSSVPHASFVLALPLTLLLLAVCFRYIFSSSIYLAIYFSSVHLTFNTITTTQASSAPRSPSAPAWPSPPSTTHRRERPCLSPWRATATALPTRDR